MAAPVPAASHDLGEIGRASTPRPNASPGAPAPARDHAGSAVPRGVVAAGWRRGVGSRLSGFALMQREARTMRPEASSIRLDAVLDPRNRLPDPRSTCSMTGSATSHDRPEAVHAGNALNTAWCSSVETLPPRTGLLF